MNITTLTQAAQGYMPSFLKGSTQTESVNNRTEIVREGSLVTGPKDFFQGVQEVSEGLYLGRKEKDLYFVMEHVDEQTRKFWKDYGTYQSQVRGELKSLYPEIYAQHMKVIDGFYFGYKGYSASFDFAEDRHTDMWVVYAAYKPVKRQGEVAWDNVELACTILTSEDAPFVVHMGIARSMTSYRDEKQLHKGLSTSIHSFAAKVMKRKYSNKVYMITVPHPVMKSIFAKALPAHISVGDNVYKERLEMIITDPVTSLKFTRREIFNSAEAQELIKEYESSPLHVIERECSIETYGRYNYDILERFTLKNKEGEVILSLDKEEMAKYPWFFKHTCMEPSLEYPYVALDYDALATMLELPVAQTGFTSLVSSFSSYVTNW